MNFAIEPYLGAGPIRLGFSVPELEEALGSRSIPVDKGGDLPTATFPDLGVHAHIATDGSCEAIEFMLPAAPTLYQRNLLVLPFAEVRNWLREHDSCLVTDAAGLTSEQLGVALYAPSAATDPLRPAEGVMVFRRNYYRS